MVMASKKALLGAVALGALVYSMAGWTQESQSQDSQQEDAASQEFNRAVRELHWVKGPQQVKLYDVATLKVPDGYAFLGTADTAKLRALEHDLADNNQYFFAPENSHWQAFFHYTPDGYVKDDEKIDADAILKSISDGTEQANQERRARGFDEMQVIGWQTPPYYDPQTHHLEWAILGQDKQTHDRVVNFNTRILGRGGVMSVVLVSSPQELQSAIGEFKSSLAGFDYQSGQRYAEYRPGDKIATYGLAALITGGAAAVAVKTGLWKIIAGVLVAGWKFIAAAFVALFSAISRFFKRKSA